MFWGGRRASALGVVVASLCAVTAQAQDVLPDLVPVPATNLYIEQTTDSGTPALRLGFDGYVRNMGPGALEIGGTLPVQRDGKTVMLDAYQRVYSGTGAPTQPLFRDLRTRPLQIVYETNDHHAHFHLKDALAYVLETPAGRRQFAKTQAGFCLLDITRIAAWAITDPYYTHARTGHCQERNPLALNVSMGIQAGWEDIYLGALAFQWVDISDIEPGPYDLLAVPDPADVIVEASESNNDDSTAAISVVIAGYRAEDSQHSAASHTTRLVLRSTAFESTLPGRPAVAAPEYRVVEAPAHGQISAPTGVWISSPEVTYTPAAGYRGPDRLRFEVRDPAFPDFPNQPSTATVAIDVQ